MSKKIGHMTTQTERSDELETAARQWEDFANNDPTCNANLRAACLRAAESLRMEIADGIARCSCCLKPYGECDRRKPIR